MQCFVYRSTKKRDTYIYVERKGDFLKIPDKLQTMLGNLEFVMNLELSEKRSLANANPEHVMQLLGEQGYYLQLPPAEYIKAQ
ncbi:hypothetical protein MNBD_GAMMA12-2467 [hydrothermal vent metagenome]|uniref:YcgL domain-containing protein n=1 Tax=hydrothermal vent metagenome TaxID=652676 RepID=A0A3B0YGZ3_9ZZZZ